jgi:hypothetical protein
MARVAHVAWPASGQPLPLLVAGAGGHLQNQNVQTQIICSHFGSS